MEKYFLLFIVPKLEKIYKTLKEMLQKQSINVNNEIGVGYIIVDNVISILEKDFFKVKTKIEAYFKTCLQNELKKLLKAKEDVSTEPEKIENYQKEIEKQNLLYSPRKWDIETKTIKKELMDIFKTKVYPNLTPRQKIIYKRLKQGQKQKEIADDLKITDRTVRNEWKRIIEKFEEVIK